MMVLPLQFHHHGTFVRDKIVDDVVEMLMKKRERGREREGERVLVAEV